MKTRMNLIAVLLSLLITFSCQESGTTSPLNESIPSDVKFDYLSQPIPVNWKSKTILGYEIQGLGFFGTSFEVTKVELFKESESGQLIASYVGDALNEIYLPQSKSNVTRGAVVFLWPEFNSREEIPDTVYHKILLSNGIDEAIYIVKLPVKKINPPIIQSPVRGNNWLCANAPSNDLFNYHRTSIITIQTIPFISQRFAVDFLRMSNDGYIVNPKANVDSITNEDFYTFGDTLYAVADAKVFSTRDGLDDIAPGGFPALNFDHADGNYVTLEIEYNNGVSLDTVYATYAHMIKGSVIFQIGDYVSAGQPIGLLGNSGNTTGPHLHFQITGKGYGALYSQGVPYEINSFHLQGFVTNSDQLGEGLPLKGEISTYNKDFVDELIAKDYLVNF